MNTTTRTPTRGDEIARARTGSTAAPQTQTAIARATTELPAWASEVVGPYLAKPDQFNLVMPAIPVNAGLGFGFVPTLWVVKVDTDPTHQEIYKVGSVQGADRFALGKSALDKLGSAAGINFNTFRTDDRRNPRRCEFACVATMKNESGAWVQRQYTKELDLDAFTDARRIEKAKWEKDATKLETELAAEMGQIRKHMAARCETGAILRAVRGLLGIRSQWTVQELAKPFVVFRVDFRPDASDKDTKAALIAHGLATAPLLYGRPPETRQVEMRSAEVEPLADDVEEDEAVFAPGADPPTGAADTTGSLFAEGKPNGGGAPAVEQDWLGMLAEGCRVLGLTSAQKNQLVRENDNDFEKAYHALSNLANERAK